MVSRVNRLYEFGPFRLDIDERVLLRDEQMVPLTPKAFDTLIVLVQNNGHVLEKEELLKAVWPDTFVEEATLAQNVFTLRKALGKEPQYIETIPKRGYRFTANVREIIGERAAGPREAMTHSTLTEVVEDEPSGVAVAKTNGKRPLNGDAPGDGSNGTSAAASPSMSPSANAAQPLAAMRAESPVATVADAAARPLDFEFSALHRRGFDRQSRFILAFAILAAVAGIAFGLFQFFSRKPQPTHAAPPFQSMEIARLPITGRAVEAAVSPSGKVVIYAESDGTQTGLWVKQIATASAAQNIVPATPGYLRGMVFSPDEEYVYYVGWKMNDGQVALYRVPALGGTARKITTSINSPVTFSPDGRRIAFTRNDDTKQTVLLITANADGTEERVMASRSQPEWLQWPAWSPDGKTIAYAVNRFDAGGRSSMIIGIDATSSSEHQLTTQRWFQIEQLAWLGDAGTLIVSAAEQDKLSPVQIWRLTIATGEVQRVTNDLNSYAGVSLTASGNALVTMQTDRLANIWIAPNGDAKDAMQITSGAGKFDGFFGAAWTPDGHVIYTSAVSGAWDIWKMDADGSNQKQLTSGVGSNYGPAASPDGRYVVFVSNRAGGAFNVWRMDRDGGNPKQLTFGSDENFAHVTADNRWVVYSTVGFNQKAGIWKVPIDGGDAVPLTDKPASWPVVSPDGKLVACTYQAMPGEPQKLAIISIDGGAPLKTFDLPQGFQFNTVYSPDGRGIGYLDSRSGVANVWMMLVNDGTSVQVTDFKTDGISAYDWSRTKGLICSRSVETTSVVLIKNLNHK
jgi:Tol biopolymer transport system component/DNA-binding winged helix-turn-helix (wHTH) protein